MLTMRQALSILLIFSAFSNGYPAAAVGNEHSCFDGSSVFDNDVWKFCKELQPGKLFMYYSPLHLDGNVKLGLHATEEMESFGWTALALAGNGGMKGASQIVVRQDGPNEEWVAEDRNSQAYTTPSLDASQDVRLLFANQTLDGETSWGVLLPMSSCDELDYPILNHSMFMLWALGEDHFFGFHGARRGQFHANLLQAPDVIPDPAEDAKYMEFLMPNVSVVQGEGGSDPTNPYICSMFDLEQVSPAAYDGSNKVHATRLQAVLSPDSRAYVHHMILYSCEAGLEELGVEHSQIIPDCMTMPPRCTEMKSAWAVGGEDVILPEHVGLPLGGRGKWYVLQTHYYNPSLDKNIFDSSGVRVYYTKTLRKHEAGIMQLNSGTSAIQQSPIPAGQTSYDLEPFIVPSRCTSHDWTDALNILGVAHHMHMAGTRMTIEVEREGQYLGSLRDEKHYDFLHQSLAVSSIQQLLPGDQLVMNCRYDTSQREENVVFGDSSQQEMCYAPIMYYPKQEYDHVGFLPSSLIQFNSTECLVSGSGAFAESSQCAQTFAESVPTFLNMDLTRLDITDDFGAMVMCNSDFYEDIARTYPGLCPGCYTDKSCTEEDIIIHAQEGMCQFYCRYAGGVSVYPDLSDTTEIKRQGIYGCNVPEAVSGVFIFTPPEIAPAPSCVKVGFVTETDEETGTSNGSRSGQLTLHSLACIVVFASIMLTV